MHFALDAVDDDQPNVVRVQAQQAGHFLDRHRAFQDQAVATLRARQELPEQFNLYSQTITYRVSKTASNSESGTSNVTWCGASGSSRMYSGMR